MSLLKQLMEEGNEKNIYVTENVSIEKELLSLIDAEKECNDTLDGLKTLHEIHLGIEKIIPIVSTENIKEVSDYINLEKSVNVLLKPIGIDIIFPTIDDEINDSTVKIAKENIKDTVKKIKDFVIGLYRKFIATMRKFFGSITSAFGKLSTKVSAVNKIVEELSNKLSDPSFSFKINFSDLVPSGKELDGEYWNQSMSASMAYYNNFVHPNAIKSFVDNVTSTEIKIDNSDSLFKSTENLLSVIKTQVEGQRGLVKDSPIKIEKNNRMVSEYFPEMLGSGSLCYTHSDEDYTKGINKDLFIQELDHFHNTILKNIGWSVKSLNEKSKGAEVDVPPRDFNIILKMSQELKSFVNNMKNTTEEFEKVKKDLDKNVDIKILSLYDAATFSSTETDSDSLVERDFQVLASVGKIITKSYEIMTEPSVKLSTYFIRTVNTLSGSLQVAASKAISGVK